MPNIQTTGDQEMTMRAVVIRADGRRENLGTIVGGNVFQKVGSFLRIKLANLKHGHRTN
jgi:hypothetical protein